MRQRRAVPLGPHVSAAVIPRADLRLSTRSAGKASTYRRTAGRGLTCRADVLPPQARGPVIRRRADLQPNPLRPQACTCRRTARAESSRAARTRCRRTQSGRAEQPRRQADAQVTQVVALGRATSRSAAIGCPHRSHTPYVPASRLAIVRSISANRRSAASSTELS